MNAFIATTLGLVGLVATDIVVRRYLCAVWLPLMAVYVVGMYLVSRHYADGPFCRDEADLRGRVVIVTGAAGGIGLHTVRRLAEMGATVVIAMRGDNKRRAQTVVKACEGLRMAGGSRAEIVVLECDLSSFASVHTFVDSFRRRFSKLNILICNAGMVGLPHQLTADKIELLAQTNHFSHFLLTHLLLPELREAARVYGEARVVNVSSLAHATATRILWPDAQDPKLHGMWLSYASSKAMQILSTRAFEERYGSENIHFYSVHPGAVKTDLARSGGAVGKIFLYPYELFLFKSASKGAETSIWAAISKSAVPGQFHADCMVSAQQACASLSNSRV